MKHVIERKRARQHRAFGLFRFAAMATLGVLAIAFASLRPLPPNAGAESTVVRLSDSNVVVGPTVEKMYRARRSLGDLNQ